jgi:pilus assembly protein CpaE
VRLPFLFVSGRAGARAAHECGLRHTMSPMDREHVPPAIRVAVMGVDGPAAQPSPATAGTAERGAERSDPRGRVVCVFSGKGGVGTSVVAANVATALAVGGSMVAMVDLNLQYGDLRMLFRLEAHPVSIDSLTHSDGHLDRQAVERAMATSDAGVRVLLAPSRPDSGDLVTPAVLDGILLHLARAYDYLVIDSPAHLDERVVGVMEVADDILLVSSSGLTSVKDTKVTLKLLQSLGVDRDHVALVLNQPRPRVSLPAEEIERALRFPVLASLPFEPRMEAAIDAGRPLVLTEPRGAFSRRVKVVVAHVGRAAEGGSGRLRRPAALWRLRFGR